MAVEGTVEPNWPWEKTHLGPPGGPQKSWAVYQGALYENFQPRIRKMFFDNATAVNPRDPSALPLPSPCQLTRLGWCAQLIALAAERWVGMWGKLEAGPFNVDCLAETWGTRNCEKQPQPVPYRPN